MSYERPTPGIYIRKSDGVEVHVNGSTGSDAIASVLCRTENPRRSWHVQLGNFWKKYEPLGYHNGAENTPPTSTTNRRTL